MNPIGYICFKISRTDFFKTVLKIVHIIFMIGFFSLSVSLHATEITTVENPNLITTNRVELIKQVLSAPAFRTFDTEKLSIFINPEMKEPRAQITGMNMSVSSGIQKDTEFLKLFMHEFGHYIDVQILKPSLESKEDPSNRFYAISWKSRDIKLAGMKTEDFVSGYAATDKYEDFAETFVYYIFHNDEFAEGALKNDILRQKYLFFRTIVFPSGAFENSDFTISPFPENPWDMTKVSFSIKKYLYFIR